MREFNISIRSFRQLQAFIALATVQPFQVLVGNERQQINGKSFIGMFSLDYRLPVCVRVNCTDDEYECFFQAASSLPV